MTHFTHSPAICASLEVTGAETITTDGRLYSVKTAGYTSTVLRTYTDLDAAKVYMLYKNFWILSTIEVTDLHTREVTTFDGMVLRELMPNRMYYVAFKNSGGRKFFRVFTISAGMLHEVEPGYFQSLEKIAYNGGKTTITQDIGTSKKTWLALSVFGKVDEDDITRKVEKVMRLSSCDRDWPIADPIPGL